VRETVPDSILDQADDIEVVDLSPEDLIKRHPVTLSERRFCATPSNRRRVTADTRTRNWGGLFLSCGVLRRHLQWRVRQR
jgi:hypothetical protein